jgi:hypothetical protein
MSTPSINQGQIAIDPVNGILYYKTRSDELVHTSLNLLQQSNTLIATEDSLEVGGNFLVGGDFTVSGNTVILNTETLLVEDNIVVLNSNVTGTPTVNAGIEINRGILANVQIIWNENAHKWQFTNNGVNYYDIGSVETASINDLSDVVLSNSTAGDFLRYNGNVWINDPVNLGTDTEGNYVSDVTSGIGISVTHVAGEGSNATISLNAVLNDLNDTVISNVQNGQLLQYNGSSWVNSVMPSAEPIGHENKADSVIAFNEGSREFSIAPTSTSYTVWCKGKRYIKTVTETVAIPNTSGLYYIHFNSSGQLSYRTTYFDWENDTPTAYIYWNADDSKAYFFADERHGVTLDWATHEYLHRTRGAAIADGFGANGYTTSGNGSSNLHAVISIANGTFFDEDLEINITHSATPTQNTWEQRLQANAYIPMFYHSGSVWKKDVATQFPMKQGSSRIQYNQFSGGTWSTLDIDSNKFGITWIVATNNLNEPIIGILGQSSYNTIGLAEAAVWENLNLDNFPVFEFRPLYKLIYQTSDNYSNTPKAAIKNLLDIRRIISTDQGIPTTPVTDHGSMTGLLDDDHPQYLNNERHSLINHTLLSVMSTASTAPAPASEGQIWFNKENGKSFVYYDSFWIEI